jgi:cyclic beta-1,2-glucan synthetase
MKGWTDILGRVSVRIPEQSLSILVNGWLLYQVISCRLWGRTGFYQSGGAFGFRDQLQDTIAALHAIPHLTRDQILLSASRQFKEGDVQHWWHPPQGRGVRTLCSDDLLWLAYTTSRYVAHTHDYSILLEVISFIDGRELNANEESNYDLPVTSELKTTLYDHCKRAISRCLRFGKNGLPLMGSGDWNDGMNKVGIHGLGESVWLAFFLYDVLQRFEPLAMRMEDQSFVKTCQDNAVHLKLMIDSNAWDGEWYRRAYFDDGSPLGSAENTECRIDSISQSWAVISGGADPDRAFQAMESADIHLVDRKHSLIKLLEPPFNNSERDPGYIKGYVPGVRENGGQYSHAAIWMVMAVAKLGNTKRTWELLNMINPINHGKDAGEVEVYKTEPYVMAADVYGVPPHTGRGGWTWYTGSAGWMYQLILESFLGVKREGANLRITPCVPANWKKFEVDYHFGKAKYHIEVLLKTEPAAVSIEMDGSTVKGELIPLVDDSTNHRVKVHVSHSAVMNKPGDLVAR